MIGVDRGASPAAPQSRPRSSPSPSSPLPRGDCRFIVLRPDVGGQRCACQGFRRHGLVPGSSCECGHQACYHVPEPGPDLALLQDRLVALEAERDARLIDDLRPRLKIVEAKVEHGQNGAEEDIRTVCRAVQGLHAELARWRRMASDRFLAHEDRIDGLLDRCGAMADELSVARARLVAMDDLTMRLEDGMSRRNRRLKASSSSSSPSSSSASSSSASPTLPPTPPPTSSTWSARVVLVPNRPLPSEAVVHGSMAYRRCLSRNLVRDLDFDDPSAATFRQTVQSTWHSVLDGRAWMPLAGRALNPDDDITLSSPHLEPLPSDQQQAFLWDREFLSRCCLVDLVESVPPTTTTTIKAIYVTLVQGSMTWDDVRRLSEPEPDPDPECWSLVCGGGAASGNGGNASAAGIVVIVPETVRSMSYRKRRSISISSSSPLPTPKKKRSFSGNLRVGSATSTSSLLPLSASS